MHDLNHLTSYQGAIRAEMNRRGGPLFMHLTFASHKVAERAKTTINGPMRRRMDAYGNNDGAVMATWARSPPVSGPEDLREQDWSMWQLHCFYVDKNHGPAIPPPIYPDTWASWCRSQYGLASNASWRRFTRRTAASLRQPTTRIHLSESSPYGHMISHHKETTCRKHACRPTTPFQHAVIRCSDPSPPHLPVSLSESCFTPWTGADARARPMNPPHRTFSHQPTFHSKTTRNHHSHHTTHGKSATHASHPSHHSNVFYRRLYFTVLPLSG